MLASIRVTNLEEAWQYAQGVYSHNCSAWITCLDPEDKKEAYGLAENFSRQGLKVLPLLFRDWDDNIPNAESLGPKLSDVERAIGFLRGLIEQNHPHHLGINCFAGCSRSTAIAMMGYMLEGNPPEIALEKVLKIRPIALPNERLLRHFDTLTENSSAIVVKKWKGKFLISTSKSVAGNHEGQMGSSSFE